MDIISKTGFSKCCMLSFIIGFPWETEKEIKQFENDVTQRERENK